MLVSLWHLYETQQVEKMSRTMVTRCCECGKKIKCSAKYKLYSCIKCSIPQCPSCNGVDIIYKVMICNGKKTTFVERCLDVECQWSLIGRSKMIETITIDWLMFVIPYQLKINIQYNGTIFVCSYFRVLRLGILFHHPLIATLK